MASYFKRGDLQWQVKIRRKGYPPQSRTFNSRAEAEAWASTVESEMARGIFVSRHEAENTTMSEALDRYQQEISVLKKGASTEAIYIRYWNHHTLGRRSLASIRSTDIATWRDERLKSVSSGTVNRELNFLSHVFTIAIKEWGMASLVNPVSQIRRPKNPASRDRRLLPDELKAIFSHTDSPNIKPIILFAIETGMRRGEIAGMVWNMVDLNKRTVILSETKNGEKRIVPLSQEAVRLLTDLPRRLDGSVWGMTQDAITKAFIRALSRARAAYEKECQGNGTKSETSFLTEITFHDLRHEATSRFFEKGLNPMQVAAITGHKTFQMLKRYTHLSAEDLAKMLDV